MKKLLAYFTTALALLLYSCGSSRYYTQNNTPTPAAITYQDFYDDLSPYGQWIDYPSYGYVWMPDIPDFRPYYSNGYWVYTDYGWTWASDYSWGWAPFHYGRWLYADPYGWMWVPGYQWAPAWVAWRGGGDYYGWAPLAPGMTVGDNFSYNVPDEYWTFVPQRYITSPRIYNYYTARNSNITIIHNTTIINNTRMINNNNRYIAGPSAADVERSTNSRLQPIRIDERNKPGMTEIRGSSISMYRPGVRENNNQNNQVRPRKIADLNEINRQKSENRTSENNQNNFQQQRELKQNPPVNEPAQNRVPENKPVPQINEIRRNENPPTNTRTLPQNQENNRGNFQQNPERNSGNTNPNQPGNNPAETRQNPSVNEPVQNGVPEQKPVLPINEQRKGNAPDNNRSFHATRQNNSNNLQQNPQRTEHPSNTNPLPNNAPVQRPVPQINNIKKQNSPSTERTFPNPGNTRQQQTNPNPPVRNPGNNRKNNQKVQTRKLDKPVNNKPKAPQKVDINQQKKSDN